MTEPRSGYANEEEPLLEQAVQRLTNDPHFMASILEAHRRQEGKSLEAQQQLLGVDRLGMLRLALCRRPDAIAFRAQTEQIALYTGAQLAPLVQLIRRVDALEGMDLRTLETQGGGIGAIAPQPAKGFAPMAAARDRIAEEHADYGPPAAPAHGGESATDFHAPGPTAPDASERPAQRRTEEPHDSASELAAPAPEEPDDSLA